MVSLNWQSLQISKKFPNFSSQDHFETSEALTCPIRTFPIEYLGVPLEEPKEDGFLASRYWKCQKKPATWKTKYLSFGGSITLIKAALSNLPTYSLSIFKMAKGIALALETLQEPFLWIGNVQSKPDLIKWILSLDQKKKACLGIGGFFQRD